MMIRNLGVAGLVLLAVSTAACGTADAVPEPEATEAPAPQLGEGVLEVAKITHSDGSSVTFYEAPGVVFVNEHGRVGGAPLYDREDGRRLGVVGLYEKLAGRAAPSALVEAVNRSFVPPDRGGAELPAEDEETPSEPLAPADDVGRQSQALSTGLYEDFFAAHCQRQGWDGTRNWPHQHGSTSIVRNDIHRFLAAMYTEAA